MWIIELFNTLLYQPLLNLLIIIYKLIPDIGLAVIFLTAFIKLLLHPFSVKSLKSQKEIQKLQPELKKVRQEHEGDYQKQAEEMQKLYSKYEVSPFSNFLFLLIQIPIIIAIFQVFLRGFGPDVLSTHLYSFVPQPNLPNPTLLSFLNLTKPNLVLAVLAGITQFFQTKKMMSFGQQDQSSQQGGLQGSMGKFTLYLFPIITVVILARLDAVVGLYWLTSILFTLGEYYLLHKSDNQET